MRKKLKIKLEKDFGKRPEVTYNLGDMESIRKYYDFRLHNNESEFLVDEITWNDLSMDRIFQRINTGVTTSGEQYLYYLLRSPTTNKTIYDERNNLLDIVEEHPDLRLKLQGFFVKLGRNRKAEVCETFKSSSYSPFKLLLYTTIVLGLIGSLLSLLYSMQMILLVFFFAIVNPLIREFMKKKIHRDLDTVNYTVSMVTIANKIKKMRTPHLEAELKAMYEASYRLKSILKVGGVSVGASNDIADMLNSWLLLDLITYEFLKNKIGKGYKDVFTIHEFLGKLDACISIASYRKNIVEYVKPVINFSADSVSSFEITQVRHPLIEKCVANSLSAQRSVLITGSNASGKSTFLKTVCINAILSQSICTALAIAYNASAFRIYSSMAIADSIISGESYYVAEIKSLKRIADDAHHSTKIFCVIDEVLKGTNTVERIAASCEILKYLTMNGVLCLAATHDIELCNLLEDHFTLNHFQEEIVGDEMLFDYIIREKAATSRNAIKLLKIMGFEDEIITSADNRASVYLNTGEWHS